jgi:hypothetical protein
MDGEEKKDASKEDLDQEGGKCTLYMRCVCVSAHMFLHVHACSAYACSIVIPFCTELLRKQCTLSFEYLNCNYDSKKRATHV